MNLIQLYNNQTCKKLYYTITNKNDDALWYVGNEINYIHYTCILSNESVELSQNAFNRSKLLFCDKDILYSTTYRIERKNGHDNNRKTVI